jgi:hypothetical protein
MPFQENAGSAAAWPPEEIRNPQSAILNFSFSLPPLAFSLFPAWISPGK